MTEVLAHPFLGGKSVGTRGSGGGSKEKQEWNSTDVYPDGSYAVIIAIDKYENAGISVNDGGFENLEPLFLFRAVGLKAVETLTALAATLQQWSMGSLGCCSLRIESRLPLFQLTQQWTFVLKRLE